MYSRIRHVTVFRYDQPIFLEPHRIRLTPRFDCYQSLSERSLAIRPRPVQVSQNLENDGSLTHCAYFSGTTTSLEIDSEMLLEIKEKNPFDYILDPVESATLPMRYSSLEMETLRPFLSTTTQEPVQDFATLSLKESGGKTVDFLMRLCRQIQKNFTYETRPTGDPLLPEQTLLKKQGSCRDFAVLTLAAARSTGLAARFVSGYCLDTQIEQPSLHAWVEIYLPGAGWRGFDPTLGVACSGHHIALATAPFPELATPIQGTFRGQSKSEMRVDLSYHLYSNAVT